MNNFNKFEQNRGIFTHSHSSNDFLTNEFLKVMNEMVEIKNRFKEIKESNEIKFNSLVNNTENENVEIIDENTQKKDKLVDEKLELTEEELDDFKRKYKINEPVYTDISIEEELKNRESIDNKQKVIFNLPRQEDDEKKVLDTENSKQSTASKVESLTEYLKNSLLNYAEENNQATMTINLASNNKISYINQEVDDEVNSDIYQSTPLFSTLLTFRKYGTHDITKMKFKIEGKLCIMDGKRDFFADCISRYSSLYHNWIVVFSTLEQYTQNMNYLIIRNFGIQAVILKEDALHTFHSIPDFTNRYFSIGNEDYLQILKYDVDKESSENLVYSTMIDYVGSGLIYQGKTFLISYMLIILGLNVVFISIWAWHTFFYRKNYFTQMQRYYTPLPFMFFMICAGVYYSIKSKVEGDDEEMSSVIFLLLTDILIKLIKIIFKTFFWILLILISYVSFLFTFCLFKGFLITNYVNKATFFFIFSIVYVGFLSDLIINNILLIEDIFKYLNFGMVKTSLFYLIYMIIVIKQTYKIVKKANLEYLELIGTQDELTQTILLKISILKWNLVIVTSYTCLYIFGNYFLSFYYKDSNSLYAVVFNITIDFMILFASLINLRPRKLLFTYEGVNFQFEEFNSIYSLKIKTKKVKEIEASLSLVKKSEKKQNSISLIASKKFGKSDKKVLEKSIKDSQTPFIFGILNPSKQSTNNDFGGDFSTKIINSNSNNSFISESEKSDSKISKHSVSVLNSLAVGKILKKDKDK